MLEMEPGEYPLGDLVRGPGLGRVKISIEGACLDVDGFIQPV